MNTKAGFLVFVGAVLLGAGTTAGISYAIGANYGPEITQQEESKDDSGLVTDIVEQKGIRMALLCVRHWRNGLKEKSSCIMQEVATW